MTFAELLEEVLEHVNVTPGGTVVTRGEAKRLLNLINREVAQRLGILRMYVDVPVASSGLGYVTGPFALPVRVEPEGVKYAEIVEVSEADPDVYGAEFMRNREIPILNVAEANRFHPRWEQDDDAHYGGPVFLMYDPSMPGTGFRPVGITTAKYRFLVYAKPEDMVLDLDEPWSTTVCDTDGNPIARSPGVHPGYHRMLAHFVAHELLQRLGDQRWQAAYARYKEMENELFGKIQPVPTHYPGQRAGNDLFPARHREHVRW